MPVDTVSFAARTRRLPALATVAVLMSLTAGVPAIAAGERARERSPELVKQLTQLMTERQLTAIAAKDPEAPDRYVAAMLFPGVQLLVIAARSDAPAYIDAEIASRKYDAVYAVLQHGVPESKLFVQDMACDGLHGTEDRTPDIVYERGVQQHMLDGDHKAARMSREAYAKHVEALDSRYAKLLTLLLQSARAPSTAAPVARR